MNRITKFSILLIYFFFAQVYPVVHWHAQEHHGDLELQLSIHPPEIDLENIDHHEQTDEHEHQDSHYKGDLDYTLQIKTTLAKIISKPFAVFETRIIDICRVFIYLCLFRKSHV